MFQIEPLRRAGEVKDEDDAVKLSKSQAKKEMMNEDEDDYDADQQRRKKVQAAPCWLDVFYSPQRVFSAVPWSMAWMESWIAPSRCRAFLRFPILVSSDFGEFVRASIWEE